MAHQTEGRVANGPAVRAARLAAGLRIIDLAKLIYVHQSFLSRVESGHRRFVDPQLMDLVAVTLGVDLESLWLPEVAG